MSVLTKVSNGDDENGEPIGRVLDTSAGSTVHYKVYSGTLSTDTVLAGFTDLGRKVVGGLVENTGANSLGIAWSIDGTNYGDTYTLLSGKSLDMDVVMAFQKMKLVYSASTTYSVILF